MILGDIEKQQEKILERIYERNKSQPVQELTGILQIVLSSPYEEIRYAIGDFAAKLRAFAFRLDKESPHPDLFDLFDGELVSEKEGSFNRDVSDLIKMCAYGQKIGVSNLILEKLKSLMTNHKMFPVISKVIDDPEDNLLHVRFVPLRTAREIIRSRKKTQLYNINLISKKDFDLEPDDFSQYTRKSNLYQKDIDEAQNRLDHFMNLGLKMMADEIKSSIRLMQKNFTESQCHGFNKISLMSAIIILAKQSNFKCKNSKIYVETDQFKYRFFAEKGALIDDSKVPMLELSPRIYPYYELSDHASKSTLDVIDYLENFPEINGHPLFDHYRVLVAGTNYFSSNIKVIDLDIELIKRKEIAAVLLGERDGDFYFISYF
jgi:hypothetical protein